jgi:8-oxo-dGTP pyrophosphatase MutT (NUDIX family)
MGFFIFILFKKGGQTMNEEICAGGIVLRQGKFLALQRHNGVWLLPKGHVDPGETLEETALREVREETGLVAKLGPKLGQTAYSHMEDGKVHNKRVHWYLMRSDSGEIKREEDIFTDIRWFDRMEIDRLTFNHDRELVNKAFAIQKREVPK